MTWSIEDVPSQSGKVIIITGANGGLGFESAKALAAKDAEVVLAVRTLSKGEDAAQQIRVVHPGVANTELSRGMISNKLVRSVAKWVTSFFLDLVPPEDGAKSQLRAAVDPTVKGGEYYGPHNGDPIKIPMPYSVQEDDIEKLWELSEQLTDVRYNRKIMTA